MFAELLRDRLQRVCVLSPEQVGQLLGHYELLLRWNKRLNLTSVRSEEEVVERHYCESLFLGVHLPPGPLSLVDLGSGAGFPGVPVAVLRPDCTVTLVESHQRKAVFLKEASRELRNVRVISRRAEDIGERFDWAMSRAVRFEEIGAVLGKLASNVAILTSESGLKKFETLKLPWGDSRLLAISRETRSK